MKIEVRKSMDNPKEIEICLTSKYHPNITHITKLYSLAQLADLSREINRFLMSNQDAKRRK